jgi:FkbM family methyltransferase
MGFLKRGFKKNTRNVLFKSLAGFGRSMNRLYENRNHDLYSNGELTIIKKLATLNPKVIVDGGANIGKYSKVVHQYIPQSTIYAFEPVVATFEQLKEKIKGMDHIIPVNKGLFSENTQKQIHLFHSNTHSSLYKVYDEGDQTIEIDLIKGDEWIQQNNIEKIDLLKLDLEGAEFDAIKGFEKNIHDQKIRAIQFEYGPINIVTKHLLRDFYAFFEDHGYWVGKIFPKKVEFRKYQFKHEDFIGPNFIAIHHSDTALIQLLSK